MLLALYTCKNKNKPAVENMKNKRNLEQRWKIYSTDYILDKINAKFKLAEKHFYLFKGKKLVPYQNKTCNVSFLFADNANERCILIIVLYRTT